MMKTKTQTFHVIELFREMTTACGHYESIPFYLGVDERPTTSIDKARHYETQPSIDIYLAIYPECNSVLCANGVLFD